MPPVLHNVALVKGMFHETLPEFKKRILKTTPIAFLHIDCDIYESTQEIFSLLGDNIVSGTVIVFDEFITIRAPRNMSSGHSRSF
ncbi:TylF/MycF/NovP-related O-methyltransferase [Mycobacterium sp. 1165196.3]|uniref:TylF/MycF/NovP-related O-methyltransferase n=1 Tax=Mycobacterium sp. 1165196.3 TaxID=1834071 RepID=UPI0009EEB9C2